MIKDLDPRIWTMHWGRTFRVSNFQQLLQTPGFFLQRREEDTTHQVSIFTTADNATCVVCVNSDIYERAMNQARLRNPIRDLQGMREFLKKIGFRLDRPDRFFYANEMEFRPKPIPQGVVVRPLKESDQLAFEEMTHATSKEDLEAGFVELDHTLVFGAFIHEKMVSRASAFAFDQEEWIFDVGYVTHPDYRNQGFGAMCASELTKQVFAMNKIPQIRVEPQRKASLQVAHTLGYPFFGTWEYDEAEQDE